MIDLDNLPRHQLTETIVDDLVIRTDAPCRDYFRVLVSYYFAKVAASMRAVISTPDQEEEIPVNCFAFTLAPSGFGKGKSVGALERGVISGFRNIFTSDTFPLLSSDRIAQMASEKAAVSGRPEKKEKEVLDKAFGSTGAYVFTSKSATASSIQQLRSKLLMSGVGAINIQVDEIGSNITDMGVAQALNVFLELYDMGQMEIAMTKNTSDNIRMEDLSGISPANLLVFGEPSKLFDGAQAELAFMQLLGTGYARRSLFAWGEKTVEENPLSPQEVLQKRIAARKASVNTHLRNHFARLADPGRHNWHMEVPEDVALHKTAYEIMCKERANEFQSQDTIRRAEMEHRHWKALKLAGAMAFVDESMEVTLDHLVGRDRHRGGVRPGIQPDAQAGQELRPTGQVYRRVPGRRDPCRPA